MYIYIYIYQICQGFPPSNFCAIRYTEGHKFHRFCCKFAKHEILILRKEQWLKETMYDQQKLTFRLAFREI